VKGASRTAEALFHLVRSRQAYGAVVLGFLNVVPDKLIGKPTGLPGGQIRVLAHRTVSNREPVTALFAHYGCHHNRVRLVLLILAQTFSCAV
jgi:hypothetical protein